MDDCVFCNIVAGKLPSSMLYENERVAAFLDIQPVNPGHTLVVPKKHYAHALETPDEILSEILHIAKKLAPAIAKVTGATGFNITFNTGRDAGQVVMHTHLHTIPRNSGDGLHLWQQKPYPDGEQEKIAQKIREAL